jgi:pimeloyl-ACP methyl ester carboxylesterase
MDKVSLVCHSFGGRVGIKLAAKYGYLVDKLILADSAGIRPRRSISYYFKVIRHKVLTALKIPHKAGSGDYQKLDGAMRETFKNVVREDLSPYLCKINAPTLIIWGDKDRETPIYMARRLHRGIKNSGLTIYCGCGHFAYLERHFVFVNSVNYFLSEDNNDLCNSVGTDCGGSRGTIKIPLPKSK